MLSLFLRNICSVLLLYPPQVNRYIILIVIFNQHNFDRILAYMIHAKHKFFLFLIIEKQTVTIQLIGQKQWCDYLLNQGSWY